MKKIILLICIPFFFFTLHAEEPPRVEKAPIQLRYFKAGTEAGLGYRWHRKEGIDLSLNVSSIVVFNWLSAKALYLQFPWYDQQRFFYWGAGAGLVYEADFVGDSLFPSLEGIVGYEFCTDQNIKYFLQLGISVPLSGDPVFPIVPALAFGVGF